MYISYKMNNIYLRECLKRRIYALLRYTGKDLQF